MSEWLARLIVALIAVAWFLTTVVLPVVVRDYTPPPEMNTVMGIVAGAACAYLFAKRGENGNKKPDARSVHERAVERGKKRR